MSMASLPMWLEGILNRKYPRWREVEHNLTAAARYMPAGLRVLEAALLRALSRGRHRRLLSGRSRSRSSARDTRVVAISTHNPLGVTFAAGVYTSIFGESKAADQLALRAPDVRPRQARARTARTFKVIVGGSGGWQITQTNTWDELGVDCVVEGRSEAADTMALFDRAIRGEPLPRQVDVGHPHDRDGHPRPRQAHDVRRRRDDDRMRPALPVLRAGSQPADRRAEGPHHGGRARQRPRREQADLAGHRRHVHLGPGAHRDAVLLSRTARRCSISTRASSTTPGVEQHVLSHATIAPAVVDPVLIEKLSDMLLDKSPIRLPVLSTHPEKRALVPLIGLETGSVRLAKQIMPSKGVPFPIDDWPSVVVNGLEILNEHNWFPGHDAHRRQPGRDRRGHARDARSHLRSRTARAVRVLHPVDLHAAPRHAPGTRHGRHAKRVQLTPLQWQLMMKCWKMNLRPGQMSWWGPMAWRTGALGMWLWKLRKLNGPNFTWPLLMFASALPESMMARMGKIHPGRPLTIKSRKELLATVRPAHRRYLRADTGDLPEIEPAAPVRSA